MTCASNWTSELNSAASPYNSFTLDHIFTRKFDNIKEFYKELDKKDSKKLKIRISLSDVYISFIDYLDYIKLYDLSLNEVVLTATPFNTDDENFETTATKKWLSIIASEFIKTERMLFDCGGIKNDTYELKLFSEKALIKVSRELIAFGVILGLIIKRHICLPYKLPDYFFKLMLELPINENEIMKKNFKTTNLVKTIKNALKDQSTVSSHVKIIDINESEKLIES
ncbi:hypothetical protein TCON_1356 [Astathelohania contejeani]|uniref:HECT domain-containing protein n=1 Tax=Astathelohania contejeani TaxID=164912 RepID=A0ABQ7HZ53_9MICR|nr:hypothetical protein TCON_1356 [Thelohania contejeani]